MHTYGIKIMVLQATDPFHLASKVLDRVSTALKQTKEGESLGAVNEVGCSMSLIEQMGGFWEYNMFIHFAMPPTPENATRIIKDAFKHMDVINFAMMAPYKKPACGLKSSSHALQEIQDTQKKIRQDVVNGRRYYVVKRDKNVYKHLP